MAICPDCAREFYLEEDDLAVGDVVHCDECGVELEVVRLNELELRLVSDEEDEEEEEDDEDDEEFEDVFEENGYYDSDNDEY